MNKYAYMKEIEQLRQAVETMRQAAEGLSDDVASFDNHGDIASYTADITRLRLAADIIEDTLPK